MSVDYKPMSILNQTEVAELFGLSIPSIIRMRKSGNFPRRKSFGGIKGWLYKDILVWAENCPVDDYDVEDNVA